MPQSHRFWFGYLDTGNKKTSSLVIYDHSLRNHDPDEVLLFNLKRNEILRYRKEIVRKKVRGLLREEYCLLQYARDQYFPAMSAWSKRPPKIDSEEIEETKKEMRREQRLYEAEHAGDRFKTHEDWANEYLQSDDSALRDLGRRMLGSHVPNASDKASHDAFLSAVAKVMFSDDVD